MTFTISEQWLIGFIIYLVIGVAVYPLAVLQYCKDIRRGKIVEYEERAVIWYFIFFFSVITWPFMIFSWVVDKLSNDLSRAKL